MKKTNTVTVATITAFQTLKYKQKLVGDVNCPAPIAGFTNVIDLLQC